MNQNRLPSLPNQAGYPASPKPPNAAPEQNPLLLVHRLLRGRYAVALVLAGLLGLVGSVCGYKALSLEYQSTAQIRIAPVMPKVLFESEQSSVLPMFDSFVQTQVSLIQSRRVVDMAMQDATWKGAGGEYSLERVGDFMECLSVVHPKNTEIIQVSFTDREPRVAQAGAKSVVDAYLSIYGGEDLDTATQRFELLEERAKSLANEIEGYQSQMYEIANEYGSNALEGIYAFEAEELQKLQTELESAKIELATFESASKDGMLPNIGKDPTKLTVEEIATVDSWMQQLLDTRKQLRWSMDEIKTRYKDPEQRPEYRLARERLSTQEEEIENYASLYREQAATNAGLSTAGANTAETMKADLELRVERLQQLFDEKRERTLALGRQNLQIEKLRGQIARAQESLDKTNARIEQLSIESAIGGRIDLLTEADMPSLPSNARRRTQFAILGGMGGAGLGVALIMLLGLVNRRIRDVVDAETSRPKLLGVLPELPENLSDPAEAMLAAQSVHHIRTLLQIHAGAQQPVSLTVTSATSGTGKTSLVLSLGLSFAAAGSRTLLIDADLVGTELTRRTRAAGWRSLGRVLSEYDMISEAERQKAMGAVSFSDAAPEEGSPRIAEAELAEGLSIHSEPGWGLADALRGEPIGSCISTMGVPNLSILPACGASGIAANGFSPASARGLLDQFSGAYDVVLVDTGPIPGQTESSVMAACTSGVIMMVSRGDHDADVRKALQHLELIDAQIVGLVFNRARNRDMERSGYSSSRASKRSASGAAESVGEAGEIMAGAEAYARFGPLAQSVLCMSMDSSISRGHVGDQSSS